ncbi:MAG TPA: nuclear transport factor 2 family protein [Gemmatimonadaceae bacterium]|nr:nuclear transport factor 2 family protein [Gemmatimonadaceae bacterium]
MRHRRASSPHPFTAAPLIVAACAAALTCARGSSGGAAAAEAPAARREIAATLDRAARDWNRGDLEAFLGDYLPGDSTTYIGRGGVVRGVSAIRAVYAPRFAPGGVRDSLSFEQLEVHMLAPGLANAIAFYVLSRGDSTVARGPTSLVMRRVGGRWRILHDHSS